MAIWARMRNERSVGSSDRACWCEIRVRCAMTVLVQQFGGAELIVAPGDDGVDAVPARGLCHFLLIDRGLAVRWNVEKPRMSFRHQAERLCASLQALEQLLQRPLSAVAVDSPAL